MSRAILGLHGALGPGPSRAAHDGGWCVLDPDGGEILSLVESEKLTGARHDPRVDLERLRHELDALGVEELEIARSHFTPLDGSDPGPFPLVAAPATPGAVAGTPDPSTTSFAGRPARCWIYLHELAHVFAATVFRPGTADRFLGLVVEGCGSFAQNALFLVEGGRATLLEHSAPILSGGFFQQWLSERVFGAARDDHALRAATPGKAMALAAYGDPERFRAPLVAAVRGCPPGRYLSFRQGFCPELERRRLSWRDRLDLCAAGQAVFEDQLEAYVASIMERHGPLPLMYGGGCALSVKANSRLRGAVETLVIPPSCADDGQALGLAAAHATLGHGRAPRPLGADARLRAATIDELTIPGRLDDRAIARVAGWLARGEVIALAQGCPEIGPRALGARSLLADPGQLEARDRINHIKGREYYRPVAPMVLEPAGGRIFERYHHSPFMLYDFCCRPEWRSRIPAVLHRDGTARVQSVPDDGSDIARLLTAFAAQTGGPPVLCNTSLNSRGRAIAGSAAAVLAEVERLQVRHLVMGGEARELS